MRTLIVVGALLLGSASLAEAGRGHGSGLHSSRSHSGMSGTGSSSSSHSVRGYTTKRGTHVAPYRQTNADHTQLNNYSTKGNVNPSNSKVGRRYATH